MELFDTPLPQASSSLLETHLAHTAILLPISLVRIRREESGLVYRIRGVRMWKIKMQIFNLSYISCRHFVDPVYLVFSLQKNILSTL